MSTLKVNTVQHNTTGFNNVVQFTDGGGTENGVLCRAWVNFDGTGTVAIRNDFNVNTVGDNGTGNYTVNFISALADSDFCVTGTAGDYNGTTVVGSYNQWLAPGTRTTTSCRVGVVYYVNSFQDVPDVNVAIFS